MWGRSRTLEDNGQYLPAIGDFLGSSDPTVEQYLRLEEFTVLSQIETWKHSKDRVLADLARRFLERDRLAMVDPPASVDPLTPDNYQDWEEGLKKLVTGEGYDEAYVLKDKLKPKYNQPYFPEKEEDEQSVRNAVRLMMDDGKVVEIASVLKRLQPLTKQPAALVRYYVPRELKKKAQKLREKLQA